MFDQKMHADEVHTDVHLVDRLLATQFPQWGNLPIEPVASAGTDNALYRLGDDMAVRLPRIHWAGSGSTRRRWPALADVRSTQPDKPTIGSPAPRRNAGSLTC